MSATFVHMLVQLALSMHLLFPGVSGLVLGAELIESQRAYVVAVEERDALVARLRELEREYQKFVGDVEKLKRSGQDSLKARRELEALLRQSRQVSDQLDALQARIRQLDGQLEDQRGRLVATIDDEIRRLEASLARAAVADRPAIVDQLNALRTERQRYTAPLPAVPDHRRLQQTFALADAVDDAHPGEMLAAADELEDTEEQLRRRLAAIETRLAELHAARRLSRRAQSFQREESFFEEGDRSRLIARYERTRRTPAGGGNNVPGGNDAHGAPAESPVAGDFDGNVEAAPSPGAGDDSIPNVGHDGPDRGASDPPMTSDPSPEPAPNPGPGYDETRESVVFKSNVDPSHAIGATRFDGPELDRSISDLEAERRRLEAQADALRRKADRLRKSAHESLR